MIGSNLAIVQGGGPTVVLNATLASILDEAEQNERVGKVFGSTNGIAGLCKHQLVDMTGISQNIREQLRLSPGAALGSSRLKPSPAEMEGILHTLHQLEIHQVLFNGGNGTMRGAEAISQFCCKAGYPIQVIGIPKTVDNDIYGTDRCPGYASAARYVAQSTRDLGMDVRSLPQPVSILEVMGRSVGWLAAASMAAKVEENDAPHLIYLPERPFDTDEFLTDLDGVVSRLGWAVVVVSEGIRNRHGDLVYESTNPWQVDALKRPLPGGVGEYLAGIISERLKIRCRSEKPGLLGRSSMMHVASRDLEDAALAGRAGVRALLQGVTDNMVSLRPLDREATKGVEPFMESECELVPLSAVAGKERPVPSAWLPQRASEINPGFLNYVRPLIGELLQYAPFLTKTSTFTGVSQ